MGVRVREATMTDVDALALVHVASWRQGYAGMLPAALLAGLSLSERADRWRQILALDPSPSLTFAAEVDDVDVGEAAGSDRAAGGVVGFASVGASRDDDAAARTGELWAIYVHPRRWGAGVGYALHAAAVSELVTRGYDEATLWVLRQNDRGRRFYERQGWVADGAQKLGHKGDVPLDEVRYRIALPA